MVFLQSIPEIPDDLKQLYKTVWEISQKTVLKMAAERGAFIDQSQSLNIHIAEPNYGKLTSMHFYGWKQVGGGNQGLVASLGYFGIRTVLYSSCLFKYCHLVLSFQIQYVKTKPWFLYQTKLSLWIFLFLLGLFHY